MMKKKVAAISLVCLSLLLAIFAGSAHAQNVSVGVAKGDKFTYQYAAYGNNTDRYIWIVWMPDQNQSRWDITVTAVSGSTVTYTLQVDLPNGTKLSPASQTIDVNNGQITSGDNYLFFVGSNLSVNDQIFPNGYALTIDQTVTRSYLNEQRPAIHFGFPTSGETFEAFSDRQTGALVDLNDTYYDGNRSVSLTLIYSSVWTVQAGVPTDFPSPSPSVPEIPLAIAVSVLVVGFLAVAAAYKAKQKRL